MAKDTHTHKGHCQACGRIQAAQNGTNKLAKHGYTVAGFGFFNGVCFGSDRQPLELERILTDFIIADLHRHAAKNDAELEKLKAGKAHPATVETDTPRKDGHGHRVMLRGHTQYVVLDWADCDARWQGIGMERAKWAAIREAEQARSHADMLTKLAANVHGKPLPANTDLTKPAPLAVDVGLSWTDTKGTKFEVVGYGYTSRTRSVRWTRADGQTGKSSWGVQTVRNDYAKRVQP